MSLASLATRICFIGALRGRTLAGDAIEDSPIDPVSLAISTASPLIVVYSDVERFQGDGESVIQASSDDGSHQIELTADLFLPSAVTLPSPGGGAGVALDVRDFGAGIAFDLMVRQIQAVMSVDQTVWAKLFRRCVTRISSFDVQAYVLPTQDKNTRFPARNITITLDVIDSPAFGGGASAFWPDFIAAVVASDDLVDLAPIFQAAIDGDPLPGWRQTAATLGLAQGEMADIGAGPLGGSVTDDEVAADQVTVTNRNEESSEPPLVVIEGVPETFEP